MHDKDSSHSGWVVTVASISATNWETLVKTGFEFRWQCRWCIWACLISDCALPGIKWTRDNLPLSRHAAYEYGGWVKSATGSNCLSSTTYWPQLGGWQYKKRYFTLLSYTECNHCLLTMVTRPARQPEYSRGGRHTARTHYHQSQTLRLGSRSCRPDGGHTRDLKAGGRWRLIANPALKWCIRDNPALKWRIRDNPALKWRILINPALN